MIKLVVNQKEIHIFNENIRNTKDVPILIHHSFCDTGEELWEECQRLNCSNFILVNISGIHWNDEMTPWECAPLYKGDKGYQGKADEYILELTETILPQIEQVLKYKPLYYGIAGYSLGGLFSLYSMYQTNQFARIVSASGSLWYPNFLDFIKDNTPLSKPEKVYLSLGDKEKNAKNDILKSVQDDTEEVFEFYKFKGIDVVYELNPGGHFKDCNLRTAKGIQWILSKE